MSLHVSSKTRHLRGPTTCRRQSFRVLFVESCSAQKPTSVDICVYILERSLTSVTFVANVLIRNLQLSHTK